jgi:tellurite resistance protein TehA-like permease
MKNIWYVTNIALVILALWFGYSSLSPEKLRHTNRDAISCGVILLVMPLFSIGSVGYSIRRWNHNRLARPSLGRYPGNWWYDPLQCLFISTCGMASMGIGSALRHPTIGSVGFWMFAVYACMALGLLVGQVLVYRIYRENIIAA